MKARAVAVVVASVCALVPFADSAAAAPECGAWSASPVAAGYGMLESVAFDGRGGMLLSEQAATGSGGGIRRLLPDGGRSTVVADVDGPGGLAVSGDLAYFTTGLSLQAKASGRPGSLQAVDLSTGAVSPVAQGLSMPDGVAALPGGDFAVTSDLGADTRITLVHNGSAAGTLAPTVTSTNGIAYDPARRRLYVTSTFNPVTTISAIDLAHPDAPEVIELPGLGPLNAADGITVGPDGHLYVAYSLRGKVIRVDPGTRQWCTIADNLPLSTDVAFGSGPGWDPDSLYVVGYPGTITRLRPA
ncbi:SMP-30/gluconolactonase/LRE family protein [Nocardia transvalensis]|uniref:SMP-30/gluconolactonase/LRE family protein n=1 Tax=Nocardia transvalensis TaxID=37333 RepID=UPI0018943C97|nr:SMP-30/gluconolactonase/LRE family protein [Nocardia transvalensis]MBF6331714.1 SMP-30/gluconolactonase/LRE family protein [Nocardia transvalensis]